MNQKKPLIILLSIVILFAAGYWYYESHSFSKGILKLEILGPDLTQVGENIIYTVKYKNNSNFTLEAPKLSFEYPQYSVSENGNGRENKNLEDIYPGQEATLQFKARLFGQENDVKQAKVTLSYKPQNLSARYESNTTLSTTLSAVFITLGFDLPSQLGIGTNTQFSLNYFSNVDYNLTGLKLKLTYPNQFTFSSSVPKTLDNQEWDIPSLAKAQGGRISIAGKTTAEPGDKIIFIAQLGLWENGDFILLKQSIQEVQMIAPKISISQQINGSSDYIVSPGENLHYAIYVRNIGNSFFEKLYLTVKLDSSAFDFSTVNIDPEQARLDNNQIIWDWKSFPQLAKLDIGDEIKIEFDVKLQEQWSISKTQPNNTIVKNVISVANIAQEFINKVNSRMIILQTGAYDDKGLFGNTGSNPPVAGQTTTYTITWQVKNFYNDMKNVKVKATLMPGVIITGKISPDTAISNFTLDSQSREIVWIVGEDVPVGTGILSQPLSISFQISVTPTSIPSTGLPLIGEPVISGEDQWTGRTVQWQGWPIDSTLTDNNSQLPPQPQTNQE